MTSFGWTELIGLSLSPLAWLYQTFAAGDLAALLGPAEGGGQTLSRWESHCALAKGLRGGVLTNIERKEEDHGRDEN